MAKPVIMTVDDDPGVSRAVARDLRRRYAGTYRIVRAESGAQALEALRELKLRGDDAAVLVADHRMPGMTGVEFLEQAMDVYPYARRVLLTAYADTEAAIRAINVVDLDHYLLKPWNPPEEKFYPVIDAQLDAWRRTPRRESAELRVVGHRWSARSYEVRDFLARNQVSYTWLLDTAPEGAELARAAGDPELPLVVTADGTALSAPTDAELAAAVGLPTAPAAEFYDLIVVGGGPAGLGAAVYGASEGLRTVLVERHASGGQAGQSSRIENYLGFPDGVSGAQLADRARRQAERFGAELITTAEAAGLEARGRARVVRQAGGAEISAHAVILATGVSYRRLDVPGLDALVGVGVYYGAAMAEIPGCRGEEVYVVGGANSAGQAAVNLSRYARCVHLVARADGLERSMSHYLIRQIAEIPNIQVHTRTVVGAAHGSAHLEGLTLKGPLGERRADAQRLFVFIGAEPRTDWLDGVVERDPRGFVLTGPDLVAGGRRPADWTADRQPYHLETSLPGVFAAGDVRAASMKRVASAVGDGAMAVALVHRYLEQA
ncbi:fused response regulator/thioredoxin-disulfide reductase [Actinomadura rubrobrunea]|uniref:Fused response regulator/thioredoxin-disulfide reductase n=1 Tax=Actinomadura rubrobrunea TaxID=115335 RepID=A0A9W6Q1E9_9ACTN|nr:FAD-dependent oxidoreductase [Actinomadura rubrobrunea]GLW66771.1 fused response regulator/thioredoxin-disulfide reductase [Actinomadura rubrobrunea]